MLRSLRKINKRLNVQMEEVIGNANLAKRLQIHELT